MWSFPVKRLSLTSLSSVSNSSLHKNVKRPVTSSRFRETPRNHSYANSSFSQSGISYFSTHKTALPSSVQLTSERYPNFKRGAFSSVTENDISHFKEILPGPERVLTDPSEITAYNEDWLKTCRGSSQVVLRPKSTEEVSQIMKYCNERCLAVVPQGGNTGLVGGSVPVFDEIVISMSLMNKIIHLDAISGTLICQSGCVLANLDNYLADHNLTMPLDLGSKGSCHIGGNLSTNAGGVRLLRYGSLHGTVLGVEVVLPSGEVMDCLSSLRKDNTGYDMKQLFIGAEGTLGIVTAVSIHCPQKPSAVNVAFLGCNSYPQILDIFRESKHVLAEILSAFEFMDRESLEVVTSNLKLTTPIGEHPFFVLVESSGSNSQHDEAKLNSFLEKLVSSGLVNDGTVATESTKIRHIWELRERIAEGLMYDGYCYKYDVSIPVNRLYELVDVMRERMGQQATRVVGYGHLGDGNLHLNITAPKYSRTTLERIEPFIYDWVAKQDGSISAEHGLGFKKKDYIYHSKSRTAVRLMKEIKLLMDPKGILNPYKTLPGEG